jgi:hypothetical protein
MEFDEYREARAAAREQNMASVIQTTENTGDCWPVVLTNNSLSH